MPQALFWILLSITLLQRLAELRLSARNQAKMQRAGFIRADADRSYAIMVIVHATWFGALILEGALYPRHTPRIVQLIAIVIFLSAQGLRLWAIRSLNNQWNTQVMAPHTAVTDPGVVTSGPYRYVRHPNYLAVILEFLCLPVIGGALVTAVVWSALNGAVLAYRIQLEERHLKQRPGYEQSMSRLPRLIPRLPAPR